MAKGTHHFKETIQKYLKKRADNDPLFAKSLAKKNKDIDGCINFILRQVKKIGAQGFTDDEIFGMAAHYYDEDDIGKCDPIECGVVVNHKPELTPEEKKELREEARNEVFNKERRRLHSGKSKSAKHDKNDNEQSSLF